ncbi:hypothetical protein BACCOPRO_01504 [Phocaeicola coprophilus DSM 18228 = JCM 13818]|uniref:Uncharacterized protein n=1 Tax=Phocaeicola coprophilus DSM 18228 = JCM 13818 TaxID=547042 RepID=S0F7E4_9BACT|nr:hypothetical protein BACCOPRO_01504 [Phocaeicola coprophilus DSM 18228 = JCM 13818]
MSTAALGCCKHYGPELWLMTESCTCRVLLSAAPETFIILQLYAVRHITPPPPLSIYIFPFYTEALAVMFFLSPFLLSPHRFYQVQIKSAAPDPHVLG